MKHYKHVSTHVLRMQWKVPFKNVVQGLVSSDKNDLGSIDLYWHSEVGNWPKKSNALALAIVSLKCNALVIMH